MKAPKTPDKIKPSQFSKILPEYIEYAARIRKTLYYGKLPSTDRPSLPFTGLSVERFSELCRQDGLERLDMRYASTMCYDACVTPCSLILALMYVDRLRANNPEYLATASPSQVFIVALLVASKYLYDDGEEDEVFNDEWATSAAVSLTDLNQAEREFLVAIDWNLFVDSDTFLAAFKRVESDVAWREGSRRGYFTYTDFISMTQVIPFSCTSVFNLVSQVFAVCIVGYTAAVVSVVAGTLLAQECTQHLTAAVTQLTSDLTVAENSSATCTETALLLPSSHPIDPLQAIAAGGLEDDVDGNDEGNVSVPGLPPHALTTLTTSILLAISSPAIPRHRQPPSRKKCLSCPSVTTDDEKECSSSSSSFNEFDTEEFDLSDTRLSFDTEDFDPSDTRLSFTTGAYWPPSSQSNRFGQFGVNSFDLTVDITDANVHYQKTDWVYSNPWMIPWLSWHVSPVYGLIHNFSGIGAPNMAGTGKMDYSLFEWLAWVGEVVQDVIDLVPERRSPRPLTPLFSRAAVALS